MLIVRLYDYIRSHTLLAVAVFVALSAILVYKIFSISYKEDIKEFLPLDGRQQRALSVYQEISGANKLFVSFRCEDDDNSDPDLIVEAIDAFVDELAERDSLGVITDITAKVDFEQVSRVSDFVYRNVPYFLDVDDYSRIDSLLADEQYIENQLIEDKQLLSFPMGEMRETAIGYDPLNLFSPIFHDLQNRISDVDYEIYEDCIFTPDLKRGVVMVTSPYGSSETDKNPAFISFLNEVSQSVMSEYSSVKIDIIGGPVIAMGNSQQIKIDSIISLFISAVLMLMLFFFAFRNIRSILLIVLSISWGMLFAVGGLAFVHDEVSIIVIGIASVIIGIAVNYPLHFIGHLGHAADVRSALKEIVRPLLIGNITTVGAFLALVPLQSVALRDLGLFSSFLLVGTIVFSLLVLPHLCVRAGDKSQGGIPQVADSSHLLTRLSEVSLEGKPWIVWGVVVLSFVFAYFSLQTTFDSNLSNINYISDTQKVELERFEQMLTSAATDETLYLITSSGSLNEALDENLKNQSFLKGLLSAGEISSVTTCSRFLSSESEQVRRLNLWTSFLKSHSVRLLNVLEAKAKKLGFVNNAFSDFKDILDSDYSPQGADYFAPLTKTVFADCVCVDEVAGQYSVVDIIKAPSSNLLECRDLIQDSLPSAYCFDVKSLNSSIAESLSDNFNYIGFMCGCIVFVFLWFSFGRIELAVLSFIPMAVSWIWILGIMAVFNIQFNIVNVILATFIFGQGDDYTIFMTEGASYEYTYRKKMLASYKHSIILSALIMFIGMGALVVARHPALHSLAEVTIVGMSSVVLMAYMFPPLIFKYLVSKNGQYRLRPLSVNSIFSKSRGCMPTADNYIGCMALVKDRYRYKGMDIERAVSSNLKRYADALKTLNINSKRVVFIGGGYGELAILLALSNRTVEVVSLDLDEDKSLVATYSAEFLDNVIVDNLNYDKLDLTNSTTYILVEPTEPEVDYFNKKCQFSCIEDENVVILRR